MGTYSAIVTLQHPRSDVCIHISSDDPHVNSYIAKRIKEIFSGSAKAQDETDATIAKILGIFTKQKGYDA